MALLCLALLNAVHELPDRLVDPNFIAKRLTHEAPWADSHGAKAQDLGAGILYYALAYAKKAHVCVCLGSGGGFVPRLMKQAQRDLGLKKGRTILVDGNMGEWGKPQWLSPSSFFRTAYADIEIQLDTTHNVATHWDPMVKIDYLHIDADHSFEGSMQDFRDYLPLMQSRGVITFHDTNGDLPCSKTIQVLQQQGFEIVNFAEIAAGVAILHLGATP